MRKTLLRLVLLGLASLPLIVSAQLELTATNTAVTLDFTGFDASGFDPAPTAGQLDSDEWAITGSSEGDLTFGGSRTAAGDYTRGTTTGGVGIGGIYSLDRGSGDHALWMQPIGGDFTPGDIRLRIQNNTGVTLNSFVVGYDILYLNDQGRGNSMNFSYSSDDVTYTDVVSENFTSPDAADPTPTVMVESKSITISGVTIPNGAFFYVRWNTDDVSGLGSRDELGLDNISVTGLVGIAGASITLAEEAAIVKEDAGNYLIIVNSTITGAHTVEVDVTGGTGTAGVDYTAIGTVVATFATATSDTILLPIIDDGVNEPTEDLTIEISNATGTATILSPNVATVRILDNDISGSELKQGDLTFYAYDNADSAGQDLMIFTNLVDITTGTEFTYVNATYETGGQPVANARIDRWYVCDGGNFADPITSLRIQYNGGVTIPAGSFFCLKLPLSDVPKIAVNYTGGTLTSADFTLELSEADGASSTLYSATNISQGAPDAVFLVQGDFAHTTAEGGYNLFNGNLLAGIQEGGTQYDLTDDLSSASGNDLRRTRVPEEIRCFFIQGNTATGASAFEFNQASLGPVSPPPTYVQRDVLSAITDFTTNWNAVTSGMLTCPTSYFSISTATLEGNWIGNVDANWFDCRNWDNFQVPDENTNVLIGADAVGDCEIISTAAFADEYGNQGDCNDLTISADSVIAPLLIQSSTTDFLHMRGDLSIALGSLLDMNGGAGIGGSLEIDGDWTNSNPIPFPFVTPNDGFLEGTGSTVIFGGDVPQTISSLVGEVFYNFEMDNPAGVSLAIGVGINGQLEFVEGDIAAATGGAMGTTIDDLTNNSLTFFLTGTYTGASDDSHVTGIVGKIGDTNFDFPVGDGSLLHRVILGGGGDIADLFRVEYFSADPSTNIGATTGPDVGTISPSEYWQISRTNGTLPRTVALGWNTSSGFNDPTGVYLARFNGTQWEQTSVGNYANTGVANTGTVTGNTAVTNFSPFTFASDGGPFPVELIAFEAQRINREASLTWQTASESNSAYFTVQRSPDGINYQYLGEATAAGFSNEEQAYTLIDPKPFRGLNYYRLMQTDLDGQQHELAQALLRFDVESSLNLLSAAPNPNLGQVLLTLESVQGAPVHVQLYDAAGKLVYRFSEELSEGLNEIKLDFHRLPAGLYRYRLLSQGRQISGNLQKQ